MPPDFRLPTADERATIRRALDSLKEIVRPFARGGRSPFDPRVLDEAHAAWRGRKDAAGDAAPMLDGLAIGLGQHLVDQLKFRWIFSDDEGSESLAVQGGKDDALVVFPVKLMVAGHAAGKQHFLAPLADKIRRDAESG